MKTKAKTMNKPKNLKALNAKFRDFSRAVERCGLATAKKTDFDKAEITAKEFAQIRDSISEPLKWDMGAGEYFPARNARGCEMFAVKVTITKSVYVRLAAPDIASACEYAKAIALEHAHEIEAVVEAEDYTR
jgi:hypothetical protein